MATRFDFHELPVRSGASPLNSDKALRAASYYLLKQSPRIVVEALDAALENSRQREFVHRTVELLILRALAEKEDGDWASAVADVRSALTIAAPRNYVRVFLDEGRELGVLIDRLDMEELRGSEAAPLARRLLGLLAPWSGKVAVIGVLVLAAAVCESMPPLILRNIIDAHLAVGQKTDRNTVRRNVVNVVGGAVERIDDPRRRRIRAGRLRVRPVFLAEKRMIGKLPKQERPE